MKKLLLIGLVLFVFSHTVLAANTSKVSPTSFVDSANKCNFSDYIYTDNAQYAFCDKQKLNYWNGYNFSGIPANAVIRGIIVELKDVYKDVGKDDAPGIRLSWNARTSWTTQKTCNNCITATAAPGINISFGNSTDTWGRSWTVSEIKTGFWVEFEERSVSGNEGKVYVDWMPVTVFYSVVPGSVTNLANQSAGETWIYWSWTNPSTVDYYQNIIYIDGINLANTSNNFYNATGLASNTTYTITVHTVNTYNEINNTNVSNTATTKAESVFISITLSTSLIDFGSNLSGTTNPVLGQNDAAPAITITNDNISTVNINLYLKGDDFIGPGTIAISNTTYAEDNSKTNETQLTVNYPGIPYFTGIPPGSSKNLWYWIYIPSGQTPGVYNSTFYFEGRDT